MSDRLYYRDLTTAAMTPPTLDITTTKASPHMSANHDADYLDYQREAEMCGTPPDVCALHSAPKSQCGHLPHRDPRGLKDGPPEPDLVNHPPHYRHPSGIQCIEVSRLCHGDMSAAIQYIWRYDTKGNPVEDLRKARWYLCDILENGLAYFPPWKAKNLLADVIAAETDELRRRLLTFIGIGHLDEAIAAISDFVGSDY